MAPSFCINLVEDEQRRLLDVARDSIASGLAGGPALALDAAALSGILSQPLGVFVTLTQASALRGCIGALQSDDPLLQGVADNAYAAAFRDPRFPRLAAHELERTDIEVSVLSHLELLAARDRNDLLDQLRPGVDGLLLEAGRYRATFLPGVWEQLPQAEQFLQQLLAKAGLPGDYWSEEVRVYRYEAACFGEAARA
jgi:AmmeMemoRadiSam system protein A